MAQGSIISLLKRIELNNEQLQLNTVEHDGLEALTSSPQTIPEEVKLISAVSENSSCTDVNVENTVASPHLEDLMFDVGEISTTGSDDMYKKCNVIFFPDMPTYNSFHYLHWETGCNRGEPKISSWFITWLPSM